MLSSRWVGIVAVLLTVTRLHAAERTYTIENPLNHNWPAELVYLDVEGANLSGDWVAVVDGDRRPAQIEPGAAPAGKTRMWFIATLPAERERGKPPRTMMVSFEPGNVESALSVNEANDHYIVQNGVNAIRLARFDRKIDAPVPLAELPVIVTGVKTSGEADFYGQTRWESDAKVTAARSEIVQRGPVFVTIRTTLQFEGGQDASAPDPGEFNNDNANAVAFDPKGRGSFYEATVRVVAGDPWVQIDEQYHLPGGANYWLTLKDSKRFDTVFWIRWFGYERFGGNDTVNYVRPEPQPMQRGPFVAMRPRWNQMPGGGQDFFLTRGGAPTRAKPEDEAKAFRPSPYDAEAPAVGVVAVHAGRWFNPYAQTIAAFAEEGDGARIRYPVNSGSRSWGLVVGPRGQFDNTGSLNGLVRRRADWTLNKQIHQTILSWERDPSKAGPNILISRAKFDRIRADLQAGKQTTQTQIVREWEVEYRKLRETVDAHADADRASKDSKAAPADREAAAEKAKALSSDATAARRKLDSNDFILLAALLGESVSGGANPSADIWLSRRYQDDFGNPTQRSTRSLPGGFLRGDLGSNGKPWGGPQQAAVGYVFTDPDHWPGWMNGWTPGNPNFHTDKYMVVAFVAAAMRDHPHAEKWMTYARQQFDDDIARVMAAGSGVGFECPGYAAYSLGLQLELAHVFENTGAGNIVAENELFRKNAIWHRHLLTPIDQRLGFRHEAPIGDTHRWTSGMNEKFAKIARFYREKDPTFASEMMAVYHMLRQQGAIKKGESFIADLLEIDQSIPAANVNEMEWGSHFFDAFGTVMRSRFGTDRETFVTLKAGRARGHYHNDEMSYHFYGVGTPISLDYNCSYSPRGDHAALHNSMTFGRTVENFRHIGEDKEVLAKEEIGGVAKVLAFASTPDADLSVAEISADRLTLRAVYPEDAKFQYGYPQRDAPVRITHRRLMTLVKHPTASPLNDYLVIRDETRSADAQQLNIHLLTRDIQRDGNIFRGVGQLDADVTLFFADVPIENVEIGRWWYFDEWMRGPGQYGDRNSDENKAWAQKIRESDGRALIPPEGWKDKWQVGEYQQWLRIHTRPGTPALWVMYPRKKGEPEPRFESIDGGKGVRVTLGDAVEVIRADSAGGVSVERNGTTTTLLAANVLPALGEGKPIAPVVVDDASPARQ